MYRIIDINQKYYHTSIIKFLQIIFVFLIRGKIVNLFIVESPAKAKTIGKYLGKEYQVIASIGHIRELLQHNDGVDVDNNFKLNYQIITKSKPQVKKICDLAKNCNKIYLASDPDREGEAIAQSLYDVLISKKVAKPEQIYRITYTEITKNAILEALQNPRKIDNNLVDAQQSRQALDYLVGFNLSPVLWKKLPGSKSAGRVQSVALRMIVDMEFEIKKFKPEEYWSVNCNLKTNQDENVNVRVVKYNDKSFDVDFPKNEKITDEICNDITLAQQFKVIKNETKDVKQNPYPPFTTALLQQDAVRKLGFSSKKTMTIAQHLYEQGLITYIRTDGMTLSGTAVADIRNTIKQKFGSNYLPAQAIAYKTKQKNAQEAHEAIRPTHIEKEPYEIKSQLDQDSLRLYDLIWKRTVACQMMPAIFARQTIDLEAIYQGNKILARVNGSQLKFNGYLAVYNIKNENYEAGDEDNDDKIIPLMKIGDVLEVKSTQKEQHFTKPPARYSEASLIKTLESYGIGRPSTYATIISVLQDREYVKLEKRQFIPTSRGIVVAVFLKQFFSKYVEYNFTAKLEEDLDIISDGKLDKLSFLKSFWVDFHKNVADILKTDIATIFKPLNDIFIDFFLEKDKNKCPKCGGELSLKNSKNGCFFGCNNYPECKYAVSLEGNTNSDGANENQEIEHKKYGKILIKKGPYGRYCEYNYNGKNKRVSIPEGDLNDEILEFYLNLPITLGKDKDGNDVKVGIGRFGAYVLNNGKFYSCKFQPLYQITLSDALEVIVQKKDGKKRTFAKKTNYKTQDENESIKSSSKSITKKKTVSKKTTSKGTK